MENEIVKHLSKYIPITQELEAAILETEFVKSYPKGQILLAAGEVSKECYFVIKGWIRSYYVKDGEEKTTEFYTEEQAATPTVYGKNIPSDYYLECIEDTIAGVGTPDLEQKMYQKFPQLESLNIAIGEAIMAKQTVTLAEFKMNSPEERYLNLLKTRPDLLQRAPLHQIASYLGIKPESLSRIRKRICKGK